MRRRLTYWAGVIISRFWNKEGDNPPIGIILGSEKDKLLMEYALHGISNQLFVSRYQLYLPDREQLERELQNILLEDNNQ